MFAFVSLVIGNLSLIYANRSRSLSIFQSIRIPNKALWWVSGGAIFFLAIVLTIPGLRNVFQFAPLHRWEIVLLILAGLACVLFAESIKIKPLQRFIFSDKTD